MSHPGQCLLSILGLEPGWPFTNVLGRSSGTRLSHKTCIDCQSSSFFNMFKTSKDIHPHVSLKIKEVPTQILPQSFDWSKHPSGPQGHPTTHPELEKRGSPQSKLICALKADPKKHTKEIRILTVWTHEATWKVVRKSLQILCKLLLDKIAFWHPEKTARQLASKHHSGWETRTRLAEGFFGLSTSQSKSME